MDVYFALSKITNRIKIGAAKDPYTRLSSLQTGSPDVLAIEYVIYDGGRPTEKALHRKFCSDRLHGEWFLYSPIIRKFIEDDRARHAQNFADYIGEKEARKQEEKDSAEYNKYVEDEEEKMYQEYLDEQDVEALACR